MTPRWRGPASRSGAVVLLAVLTLLAPGCGLTRKIPDAPENALTADMINYRNGLALLREGRADEAIALLRRAQQSYPNDPNVWNALGLAILYKKDYPNALKAFDNALFVDPKFVEARNNRGVALMDSGRTDEAEKEFRAVLDSPESREKSNARLNLGILRAKQRLWSDAESEFSVLISDDPHFLRAFRERGIARVRKDDFRGGLEDLLRYLKQEPKDAEANYNAALCLLSQGRRDLASKYMRRVVDADPEGEDAKKARRFLGSEGQGGAGRIP